MKSSYELAMDRLNKTAPTTKLSAGQKKEIAELESKSKAKIAERELALKDEILKAAHAGEGEKVGQLQQQLTHERKKLQAELETKKEAIHRTAR
jgi:hypothetical protein